MAQNSLQYDAIIIGSGQGGNPLAQALAKKGEKVALVESGELGGTCINTGCTPTKTMVASAQVAHYARNAKRWGVEASEVKVDISAVLARKQKLVDSGREGWETSVNKDGAPTLHRGRARFTGAKTIDVSGVGTLEAKRFFIDTGTVPTVPPIEGLRDTPHLTNVTLLELREIPEHLVVLGGGYIGLEFAQMYRRFGSRVTVIQDGKQILPHEDEDIADQLQRALEAEGIEFEMDKKAVKAEKTGASVAMTLEDGAKVTGSHLLTATGRTPQTEDLDLAKAGVKTDEHGYIVVNDRLETSAPDIWALGDVKGGPAFTHISYNDYQIVYSNLYDGANNSTKTRVVPYAVYTDPPLGRVGMTEKRARERGGKLKIGKLPMSSVARARERDETAGLMKIVVDGETDKVLGAAFLGVDGDDVVQIISTLIWADKPYTLLKGAVYIHPTAAEGLFSLLEKVESIGG